MKRRGFAVLFAGVAVWLAWLAIRATPSTPAVSAVAQKTKDVSPVSEASTGPSQAEKAKAQHTLDYLVKIGMVERYETNYIVRVARRALDEPICRQSHGIR